ncbi:MAG TPA: zf-HC2 domain-containing protein [Gemmatimonadaceae bacterium]
MPNRSECEAVVRQLWPYLDGAVPETLRERIVIHLEQCVHCTSHFEFARAFLDAVAASRPHMPANARLQSRVLSALASEGFTAI